MVAATSRSSRLSYLYQAGAWACAAKEGNGGRRAVKTLRELRRGDRPYAPAELAHIINREGEGATGIRLLPRLRKATTR